MIPIIIDVSGKQILNLNVPHRANGKALDSVINFMETFAPFQDAEGIIRLGTVVSNVNSTLILAIEGYLVGPSFRKYDPTPLHPANTAQPSKAGGRQTPPSLMRCAGLISLGTDHHEQEIPHILFANNLSACEEELVNRIRSHVLHAHVARRCARIHQIINHRIGSTAGSLCCLVLILKAVFFCQGCLKK